MWNKGDITIFFIFSYTLTFYTDKSSQGGFFLYAEQRNERSESRTTINGNVQFSAKVEQQ